MYVSILDTRKIKQLRLKTGMTMPEAAKRAGFKSRQDWYQIESGRRTNIKLATLVGIARALHVRPKSLLTN